jgi:hypothetical protein
VRVYLANYHGVFLSTASFLNGLKGLITGSAGMTGDLDELPLMHRVITTQRYKYVYRLAAGKAGAWDVALLENMSVQPRLKINNTELDWARVYNSPGTTEYGTFVQAGWALIISYR